LRAFFVDVTLLTLRGLAKVVKNANLGKRAAAILTILDPDNPVSLALVSAGQSWLAKFGVEGFTCQAWPAGRPQSFGNRTPVEPRRSP